MSYLHNPRRAISQRNAMPPVFSKIPVLRLPHMTIVSGLKCGHLGCDALFVNLGDSKEHAVKIHDGKVAAMTCAIYEHTLNSGDMRLHRVLEEDGEQDCTNPYFATLTCLPKNPTNPRKTMNPRKTVPTGANSCTQGSRRHLL